MNSNLQKLQPYPFERLTELKNGIIPPQHLNHISLSIGEPKHPAPDFVKRVLADSIDDISRYPTTKGILELREVISSWLETRFQLKPGSINPGELINVIKWLEDNPERGRTKPPTSFGKLIEIAVLTRVTFLLANSISTEE